jgi:hypothetical protein
MRVVAGGLSVTDRIVVNGLQRARPGIPVKPTPQEPGGAGTPVAPPEPHV